MCASSRSCSWWVDRTSTSRKLRGDLSVILRSWKTSLTISGLDETEKVTLLNWVSIFPQISHLQLKDNSGQAGKMNRGQLCVERSVGLGEAYEVVSSFFFFPQRVRISQWKKKKKSIHPPCVISLEIVSKRAKKTGEAKACVSAHALGAPLQVLWWMKWPPHWT